jgi:hypothetical protein
MFEVSMTKRAEKGWEEIKTRVQIEVYYAGSRESALY